MSIMYPSILLLHIELAYFFLTLHSVILFSSERQEFAAHVSSPSNVRFCALLPLTYF